MMFSEAELRTILQIGTSTVIKNNYKKEDPRRYWFIDEDYENGYEWVRQCFSDYQHVEMAQLCDFVSDPNREGIIFAGAIPETGNPSSALNLLCDLMCPEMATVYAPKLVGPTDEAAAAKYEWVPVEIGLKPKVFFHTESYDAMINRLAEEHDRTSLYRCFSLLMAKRSIGWKCPLEGGIPYKQVPENNLPNIILQIGAFQDN